MKIFDYLVLARPANIITAVSDILAGVAIAGVLTSGLNAVPVLPVVYLVLATIGLYGGGIVFNDIFDFEVDKIERPERPLPSGRISRQSATAFGAILFVFGISFAGMTSLKSGGIALTIVAFALLYDKYAKHHVLAGPLTMGLCRGLNLLLGMSIYSSGFLPEYWMICFLPIVFIAAITLTSQGEVHGNNKMSIAFAFFLDLIVAGTVLYLGWQGIMNLWEVLPFIIVWIGMNAYAKMRAIIENVPGNIMKAVKMGVISLIPLNASYVAGFGHWTFGLAVLCLLPVSLLLAKKFAVT